LNIAWPIALLALILYPIVWLIAMPFRLLGISVRAVFGALDGGDNTPGPGSRVKKSVTTFSAP
jgi:hypothetical protein